MIKQYVCGARSCLEQGNSTLSVGVRRQPIPAPANLESGRQVRRGPTQSENHMALGGSKAPSLKDAALRNLKNRVNWSPWSFESIKFPELVCENLYFEHFSGKSILGLFVCLFLL